MCNYNDDETLEDVIYEIKNWNYNDINKLRYYRERLLELTNGRGNPCMNLRDSKWLKYLPSDLHDFVRDYPIWACDMFGRCLVGDGFDTVERVDDLRMKIAISGGYNDD